MTLSRTETRSLLDRHGLDPSRALGQNFLCDSGTVDKIVRLAMVETGRPVVEIGPGLGALTRALCDAGAQVTAVEIDQYILPALREVTEPYESTGKLRIVHADAMTLDWDELLEDHPGPWSVVANLPYNVATPLVLDLIRAQPKLSSWLVMVQKEAGERLVAGPGSRIYGIPSVVLGFWADARLVGAVRPEVFLPRPNVDSVLVKVERSQTPKFDVDYERFSHLVRTAFGQRRKMLRRSLANHVSLEQMQRAQIDPTSRPEELSIEQWAEMTAESQLGIEL